MEEEGIEDGREREDVVAKAHKGLSQITIGPLGFCRALKIAFSFKTLRATNLLMIK